MKTKKGSPSGVGCRMYAATKSKPRFLESLFMLFIAVLASTMSVKAADFYAALQVSVQSGGKIKVIREGASDMTDYSTYSTSQQTATSPSVARQSWYTFEIGATPAVRGKKFNGWSNFGGNGSPAFLDGYSKSSPIAKVKVRASSGSWGGLVGGTNTATITANFVDDPDNVKVTYLAAPTGSGSYTVTGPSGYGTVTIGDGSQYTTYSGDVLRLTATPAAGYAFIRFYTIDASGNVKTLGNLYETQQDVSIKNLDDMSGVVSVGVDIASQPFAIGTRTFGTLDAATQAVATTSSKTILVINDATVDAGNYTIPSGVTLLVPKALDNTSPSAQGRVERTLNTSPSPSCYRTLTLAEGANIIVNGAIEVGGTQSAGAQGANGAGIPIGTYGKIAMVPGSKIVFNNNAKLYAWGFVTGDGTKDAKGKYLSGEIDVRKGATVYEQFQMFDWKGGSHSAGLLNNSKGVFPINQYFIQNVEVPTTYHPGSALKGMTSIAVSNIEISGLSYTKTTIIINCDQIGIVGEKGTTSMFLMDPADPSEDTWVRKWYDVQHDKQVYEVNSSAELGGMQITMAGVPILGDLDFNSENYTLPVTNNLKIHLLDGTMDITQNTVLLPGAEIEINKTATVSIKSGKKLYLYDAEEWEKYVFSDAYAQHVLYSPSIPADATHGNQHVPTGRAGSWSGSGASAKYVLSKPASAAMNVHGTFDVKGALYTTAGGANIFSSIADAGTVKFTNAAAGTSTVSQPSGYTVQTTDMIIVELPAASKIDYADAPCTSAKLANEAGSAYSDGDGYTETAGTDAGQSFCFLDIDGDAKGEWVSLTTDGCFVYDSEGIYYAKPSDYVALQNGKTPNADHTYSSADDSRSFILICDEEQTDCQWWEVIYHMESGLYYCDKNKTYYFYDEDAGEWIVKKFTITWQNWDGSPIMDGSDVVTYYVPYGSTPKFNHSTPTRPDDVGYYTYDFTGWAPAFAPVTADVTYVAQYERNPVMYTITWQNANGTEREVDYFQRDEMPVCRTQPADMSALEWRPAVAAVTGNATYRLYPKDNVGPYDIKFVNWNGAQIGATQSVAKGSMPNVPADPTKPALDDVEFIFAGWSPEVVAATAAATYTATFTEQPITYTILWKNYDDATLETDENVAPNAVPQYNGATPTKPSDEDNNYIFDAWTPEVVAATEDAIYTATFTPIPKDKIVDGAETIEEGKQQTVTNLTIEATGKLVIPSTSRINATNLYLEATSNASGQLITNANTSINVANAYFDWTMNGTTGSVRRTWYAVAVPWEVNAETGILDKATGRTMVAGRDFDLIYYSGADRATNGNVASNWQYVQWDIQGHDKQGNPRPVDNLLHPGRLYMMYFAAEGLQTVRFVKADGAAVMYTNPIAVETYAAGDSKDANWNGIANPRTYFASLSAGSATYAQVLNNGNLDDYFAGESSPVYQTIDLASSKFMVGKPVFLQAEGNDPLVVTRESTAGIVNAAPRRNREESDTPEGIEAVYHLTIAADGKPSSDNLYVQVSEDEKADKYVIGQDLAKGGVAAKRAQMWINRYNAKLSVNTQMLTNDAAEYPLTIFAPAAGEYTIAIHNSQFTIHNEDYALYLTLNGEAIWNLSDGDYTFTLPQGNTAEYGLRIRAKAPEVATGIEEAIVDAQGETRKVMLDQKVYIIRGNNIYSIDGRLVK